MMVPRCRRILWVLPSMFPPSNVALGSLQCASRTASKRWLSRRSTRRHTARTTARYLSSSTGSSGIPEEFQKSYHIAGMGKKSQSTMRTDTGFKLETDVPLDMGGENSAPQPVETLLAALVGCTQATALFVGRQMEPRILLESLDFDLTAVRDQRGALELPITELPSVPAQLQCVEGTITVYIKQSKRELARVLTDEELTLFSQQTEARCPVASMMMASGCEFKIKWVNGEVAPPPRDD